MTAPTMTPALVAEYRVQATCLDSEGDQQMASQPLDGIAKAAPLAQVHATLALAAATALCHPGDDQTPAKVYNAWHEAAAENPEATS